MFGGGAVTGRKKEGVECEVRGGSVGGGVCGFWRESMVFVY